MSGAVARIALERRPVERPRSERTNTREEPFKLVEEAPAPKVPTAEQLALAGMLPMQLAVPIAPVETPVPQVQVEQVEQVALAPLLQIEAPKSTDEREDEPLTPLEQAVVDLIERIEPAGEMRVQFEAPKRAEPVVEIREPRALPEPVQNPNHVHLVIDEGERRVVVTVAVRGNDVSVALRTPDDTTAAALARNASTLDEAMRTRGLELAELSTGHEPPDRERPQKHRERQAREHFDLEKLT